MRRANAPGAIWAAGGSALAALGAKIHIASAAGNRQVDAEKFFVAPTSESVREIDLKPNEILTGIVLPAGRTRNATWSRLG